MSKLLNLAEEWLITLLMGGATLLIFLSVVHRYGSGFAIPGVQQWMISLHFSWAQELCIIMFVWMAKFGAAYGVRAGVHVGIDVLVSRLPEDWRKAAVYLSLACGIVFTFVVGTMGARLIWGIGLHYATLVFFGMSTEGVPEGQVTADIEWPSWLVYSAIPLGSYLMCLRFVQVTWGFFKTGELPHHDHAQVDGLVEDEGLTKQPTAVATPVSGTGAV